MKLHDPRLTLIAGLALAIGFPMTTQAQQKPVRSKSIIVLAKAPGDPTPVNPAPVPQPDPNLPPVTTSPLPTSPQPGTPAPVLQSVPSGSSGVVTAPLQLGSPPALSPANRLPLGMHYGEQERLDALVNPPPRQLDPYPYPLNSSPLPVDGVPVHGAPVVLGTTVGSVDRFGVAPPPGTLGQTYKRRSRPIEDNKHPRVGAVEVHLPEGVDVTAPGLKSKWTGKVWRLESDSLVPGVPHIYEVKASWGEGTPAQYRTIRLIMGRIVDLEF